MCVRNDFGCMFFLFSTQKQKWTLKGEKVLQILEKEVIWIQYIINFRNFSDYIILKKVLVGRRMSSSKALKK